MSKTTDSEVLDQTPLDSTTLALMGEINSTWAQLDIISSGALAALLKIDPVELGIVIGRTETQAKIAKMHSIVRHRRNKTLAPILMKIKKSLAAMRSLRNVVTHGVYIGRSNRGEILFRMASEFLIDDGQETAHEMFVYTTPELQQHIMDVTKISVTLLTEFGLEETRRLFDVRAQVRITKAERSNQDKGPKTLPTPPQSSEE